MSFFSTRSGSPFVPVIYGYYTRSKSDLLIASYGTCVDETRSSGIGYFFLHPIRLFWKRIFSPYRILTGHTKAYQRPISSTYNGACPLSRQTSSFLHWSLVYFSCFDRPLRWGFPQIVHTLKGSTYNVRDVLVLGESRSWRTHIVVFTVVYVSLCYWASASYCLPFRYSERTWSMVLFAWNC